MRKQTLRAARRRAKLTQEQLEAKSGVDQSYISRLESGKIHNPSFDTVTQLAEALDIDPRTLTFVPAPEAVAS